ncbi:MAG: hypothetical protein VYE15_04145, partial [Myxococcota bacterium]|nr:hypothetical protein [Myxococcota bacterium]
MKRVTRWSLVTCVMLAGAWVNPGSARSSTTLSWSPSAGSTVTVPGALRLVTSGVEGMAIEAADPSLGDRLQPDLFGQVRLRLNPRYEVRELGPLKRLVFEVEGDVTSAISPNDLSTALTWDPVWQERSLTPSPRLMQSSLTLSSDFGLTLRAGVLRSSWGTGMLANGGQPIGPDEGSSPFGVVHTGDRVARLQLLWMLGSPGDADTGAPPRLLGLSVATDAVVDDDTSNWLDGDRTYQALAAVRGRYGHLHGGLYFVHRVQEHQTGGRTRVEVLDAYV